MKYLLTGAILAMTTAGALAGEWVPVAVPEIDALAGLSALGVIGAIAALIWERKRR